MDESGDCSPVAVPLIDISPFCEPHDHSDAEREALGRRWDQAMRHVGFAQIVGHGVPSSTIAELQRAANEFFAQPAEAKLAFHYGAYGNPQGGFTPTGTESVSRSRDAHGSDGGASTADAAPDLVESFIFKPDSTRPPPPSLAAPASAYHKALEKLLCALHKMSAAALQLPPDFFDV